MQDRLLYMELEMKYYYRCKRCGNETQVEQSINHDPLTVCDICGDPDNFYRVIRSANFMVVGEGWTSKEKSGMYHRKGDT